MTTINVSQHFFVGCKHWGGAKLEVEFDIYLRVPAPVTWRNVGSYNFTDATVHDENAQVVLTPGNYECVLQCTATDAINGVWHLQAYVGNTIVLDEEGDVLSKPPTFPTSKRQFSISVS